MTISKIQDTEIQKQGKNSTDSQKRNLEATKEGVVVNSLIKPTNINYLYDAFIISDDAKLPQKINDDKITKDKSLMPLSIIATGVMAAVAMVSALVKKSASVSLSIKPEKKLDDIIRNVNMTDENVQSIYQLVHCPNKKTALAATGVMALGAMGFMGKMFIDGFKEVWVKKREADIQKNLQENLIAVETQAFSGKMQIIRSMLADKAREFNDYLCLKPNCCPPVFKNSEKTSFGTGENKEQVIQTEKDAKSTNIKYFTLGAVTLGAIVGLGFLSIRNLSKGKKNLEKYIDSVKNQASEIAEKSSTKTKNGDKTVLKSMLQSVDASSEDVKATLSKLKWSKGEKESFINEVISGIQRSTTKPPIAVGGDGTPKPAFNTYINDYRAFFYNYLLDSENPQFKMLFWSITGLTALTYGGKTLGEAVKEVQVKKLNAQTELELQQRLVATELRNFKAKKDSAIEPLCEEFYAQNKKGKSKEELQVMAENILFEVKNGPPFVYS